MKKFKAVLYILMGLSGPVMASDIILPASSQINTALNAGTTKDIDLDYQRIDAVSVQVVFSSANAQAVTFTDGTPSVGNITVSNLTSLSAAKASDQTTIVTNSGVTGQSITVTAGGVTKALVGGTHFKAADVSSNTAINLVSALNANFSSLFISTVQPGSAVVFSTAVANGSAGNAFTLTSSTVAMTVLTANFAGGQDNAVITIGGYSLTATKDFAVGASNSATAILISSAINNIGLANGGLASVIVSTVLGAGNVVFATSTFAGAWTNFSLLSSTPSAIAMSGAFMTGGKDSDINYNVTQNQNLGYLAAGGIRGNNNTSPQSSIVKASTAWGTAQAVLFTGATKPPAPLVNQTTYFASNIVATSFQLSDTSTGAVAGLFLGLTINSITGNDSFTLTPLALSGTPSFKLQYSNDDVNFTDVYVSTSPLLAPFQASTSFASPYTAGSSFWNLGNTYYRWLRFVYTAATNGATNINYMINGKKFAN